MDRVILHCIIHLLAIGLIIETVLGQSNPNNNGTSTVKPTTGNDSSSNVTSTTTSIKIPSSTTVTPNSTTTIGSNSTRNSTYTIDISTSTTPIPRSSTKNGPDLGENGEVDFLPTEKDWLEYKKKFNKNYSQNDDIDRKPLYIYRVSEFFRFNRENSSEPKWLQGENIFTDWFDEELDRLTSSKNSHDKELDIWNESSNRCSWDKLSELAGNSVSESLNYTAQADRVSRVGFQGQCASGWAFATTGLLEGQIVRQRIADSIVKLSENATKMCVYKKPTESCHGGKVEDAIKAIQRWDRFYSDSVDANRTNKILNCNEKSMDVNFKSLKGLVRLPEGDEEALKWTLVNYGPIAVDIYAPSSMFFYTQGIMAPDECIKSKGEPKLNHSVLLVGYGRNVTSGIDYWILKNSWSKDWGQQGYFLLQRGVNMCGLADNARVAIFNKSLVSKMKP